MREAGIEEEEAACRDWVPEEGEPEPEGGSLREEVRGREERD